MKRYMYELAQIHKKINKPTYRYNHTVIKKTYILLNYVTEIYT